MAAALKSPCDRVPKSDLHRPASSAPRLQSRRTALARGTYNPAGRLLAGARVRLTDQRDSLRARQGSALGRAFMTGKGCHRAPPFGLAARPAALPGHLLPNSGGASASPAFYSKSRQHTSCRQADMLRAHTLRHECRSSHANSMGAKLWNGRAGNQPEQLRQGRA
jgi:hypothetical protein